MPAKNTQTNHDPLQVAAEKSVREHIKIWDESSPIVTVKMMDTNGLDEFLTQFAAIEMMKYMLEFPPVFWAIDNDVEIVAKNPDVPEQLLYWPKYDTKMREAMASGKYTWAQACSDAQYSAALDLAQMFIRYGVAAAVGMAPEERKLHMNPAHFVKALAEQI